MGCEWCGGMGPESGLSCSHCERENVRTDYIEICSSPVGEDCAQVGSPDFESRARVELKAFKAQLERIWPDGDFAVKWFPHDFGSYGEVVAWMHGDDDVQTAIAYEAEANTPEVWDDIAMAELKEAGIK